MKNIQKCLTLERFNEKYNDLNCLADPKNIPIKLYPQRFFILELELINQWKRENVLAE